MSIRHVLSVLAGAAALGTAAFVSSAGAAVHAAAGPCKAVSNVEAIVDDSGSMSVTDPNVLRGQAVKLIVQQEAQGQPSFVFGAVSFGDPDVHTLFAPAAVGPNSKAMLGSLGSLQADDGGTNYGLGFNHAAADNPNRQANIFMTDGENFGDPVPLPQPPTYVIGFGDSATSSDNVKALQDLATGTDGQYYPQTSSAKLVSVVNSILAQITCQTQPRTFNDVFKKPGQSISHSVNIGSTIHSASVVASYPTSGDQFTFKAQLFQGRKQVAATTAKRRKLRKLKLTITRSETFFTAHVRGLVRGKLKFTIKAKKLGVSADPNTPAGSVTTQFTPSRKR
jgi:VWA domain-containing protein